VVDNPLVSVVVPAFNAAGVLGRALASVAAQTMGDWELVVVDDGSTDATAATAEAWQARLGDRMRVVRQEHAGSSVARNTGLERARGRYAAFLDADDEFVPHKLARQLELFALCSDLGLVYSDYAWFDVQGRRHPSFFAEREGGTQGIAGDEVAPGLHVCGANLLDHMIGRYVVSPITAVVRRDVLGADVRFPPGQQYSEEWWFFLEVVSRCRAGFVQESLAVQHCTAGSLSRTSAMRNNAYQARLFEHILRRFPCASQAAQAEVRRQLGQCCRQLGMDCYKQREFRRAAEWFRQALGQQAGWRDVVHFTQAWWAALTGGGARSLSEVAATGESTR
jgi:glycosyltransferase involved in cell wall biosynthesis